jgi:hypothetical protein
MNEIPRREPEQYGENTIHELQNIFKTMEKNPYQFKIWKYALEDLIDFREKEEKLAEMEKKISVNDSYENVVARQDAHIHFSIKQKLIADRRTYPPYSNAYEELSGFAEDLEDGYQQEDNPDPVTRTTHELHKIEAYTRRAATGVER